MYIIIQVVNMSTGKNLEEVTFMQAAVAITSSAMRHVKEDLCITMQTTPGTLYGVIQKIPYEY